MGLYQSTPWEPVNREEAGIVSQKPYQLGFHLQYNEVAALTTGTWHMALSLQLETQSIGTGTDVWLTTGSLVELRISSDNSTAIPTQIYQDAFLFAPVLTTATPIRFQVVSYEASPALQAAGYEWNNVPAAHLQLIYNTLPSYATPEAMDADFRFHHDTEQKLEWEEIPHALEYDLEWVFIQADAGLDFEANPEGAFAFKKSVRVRLRNTYYHFRDELENTYEAGKIYVRVRGVGRHPDKITQPLFGDWYYSGKATASDLAAEVVVIENTESHEKTQNWQAVTTFAEEGKYKKSDELLRWEHAPPSSAHQLEHPCGTDRQSRTHRFGHWCRDLL